MRIRRVQNRVYKGKEYERWLVTIPPSVIEEMGWTEKTEVELRRTKHGLILSATGAESRRRRASATDSR